MPTHRQRAVTRRREAVGGWCSPRRRAKKTRWRRDRPCSSRQARPARRRSCSQPLLRCRLGAVVDPIASTTAAIVYPRGPDLAPT